MLETTPTNPALTGLRVIDVMHAGLIRAGPVTRSGRWRA